MEKSQDITPTFPLNLGKQYYVIPVDFFPSQFLESTTTRYYYFKY